MLVAPKFGHGGWRLFLGKGLDLVELEPKAPPELH